VFLPIFSNLLTLAGLNILEKGEKRYKHMGKDESSLCKFCSPSTTNLSVRQCVCECVGRHHCWAAGPLGLGFHVSLYIVVHLYAIQQFTILHSLAQMNPLCLYQCPPQGWMAGSMHVLGLGELLCLLPLLCCCCQFCVWLEG
jgi:hypothetical protein